MNGRLMLVALVASKMEPKPENKPKFIDYTPEPRKKRKYKRMTDDIHELQKQVSEQSQRIEALTKENERLHDLMGVEHCPSLPTCYSESKELDRLREEQKELVEALREAKVCIIQNTPNSWVTSDWMKLIEKIQSLLSKFEVPNQS